MDELETYRAHIERHQDSRQDGGRRKYDPVSKSRGYFTSGAFTVDAVLLGLLGLAALAMTLI